MIFDKQPLPDDPTPSDAPPSYDTLGSASPRSQAFPLEKNPLSRQEGTPIPGPSSHSYPPSPHQALPPKSPLSPSSLSSNPGSLSTKGKGRATNWFNFSASAESRTAREVRTTVLRLVRDLIQENTSSSPASTGILQSCADACSTHSLSLSSILQEKSIENHTPLYWAIVKRLPDQHQDVEETLGPDLLSALISYASPLKTDTITDLRLACLATSDQPLFQRLRLSPEFSPVSGSDQVLLGMSIPPDDISVENLPGDAGAFAVNFVIPHFHKRMVVSKEIALEFIARSRMWRLSFFVAPVHRSFDDPPTGSWCISLSLLETSPPTYINSRLVISEAKNSEHSNSSSTDPPSPKRGPSSPFRISSNKNATISITLRSRERLQAAQGYNSGSRIVVALEESLAGSNLQYGNSPYIASDEKLRMRFEARLEKTANDAECVIC